jgi:sugar-specific transcriptional regulator TrmB
MSVKKHELARGFRGRDGTDLPTGDPLLEGLSIDGRLLEVYRMLLLHGAQQPQGLARLAGMPEDHVREAIGELTRLTLIRPSLDRPGEMIAVDPHLGLRLLMARAQEDLARRQAWLEKTRDYTSAIIAEYGLNVRKDNSGGIEVLHGLDEIRARLEAMAEECREETMSLHPYGALPEESIKAAKPVNRRALRRGVILRAIYLDQIVQDKASLDYIDWIREQGGDVRTSPKLPLRLLIIDRRVAIMATDVDHARSATILYEPAVLRALCALFEVHWEMAHSWSAPPFAPFSHPDGLTRAHVQTLALLSKGAKDDAIARTLGVSVRTERRIVAEIMTVLNANSRFEAGAKAARMGWVLPLGDPEHRRMHVASDLWQVARRSSRTGAVHVRAASSWRGRSAYPCRSRRTGSSSPASSSSSTPMTCPTACRAPRPGTWSPPPS